MASTLPISPRQRLFFAILVNMTVPLAGMSTDIYLPSLPALSSHFNVSKALVQLTVTAFVMAMGLAQLFAGPISDALGRKKLIFIALLTQLFAIIWILFSPSIHVMIVLRFVQGLGAAFMIVPARAIINDVFTGSELKKQFNYCTISFALGPIIAPFLGGYLQHYFGWQANFIFTLAYAVLLTCLVSFVYRETLSRRRAFSMSHLWTNYRTILSNRYFLISALCVGMTWGYVALFNITGPFIIQTVMHHTAITYGHVALLMGLAWFLGNSLNRVLFHYDIKTKTQIVLWLVFVTTAIMLILTLIGYFNIPTLATPIFMVILLSGVIFPMYIGECLVLFSDLAASANACLFSLIWIIFGLFTTIATLLKVHSLVPLSITFIVVSGISLLFYYGLVNRIKTPSLS